MSMVIPFCYCFLDMLDVILLSSDLATQGVVLEPSVSPVSLLEVQGDGILVKEYKVLVMQDE